MSEVVGAAGRMGSLWLRETSALAVPRGVCPGSLSDHGEPVYLAVPSSEWRQLYRLTDASRRDDLVYIGNGLVKDYQRNSTVVVPHFGVLRVGANLTTSPSSPPTFVFGKHAAIVASFLEKKGVLVREAQSWAEISTHAARKLLWASIMWLLCHSTGSNEPLKLREVHAGLEPTLVELVQELLPALNQITGTAQEMDATLDYLKRYSLSMPEAIPSKDLAMKELVDRNLVLLKYETDSHKQTLHRKLLLDAAASLKALDSLHDRSETNSTQSQSRIEIPHIDVAVHGIHVHNMQAEMQANPHERFAVIGSGIMGTSAALNLARKGVQRIVVYDVLPEHSVGRTTPASWAWLNANQKTPISYKWLNQLGMRGWRVDPILRELPKWTGSLVRTSDAIVEMGGYPLEGPLSQERAAELEPCANFTMSDESKLYYFPSEGHVDPALAVKEMQKECRRLGVQFEANCNVSGLVRDDNGKVAGLRIQRKGQLEEAKCDCVVVAAGTGCASSALGAVPLIPSPGRIAFAQTQEPGRRDLRRIIVDTITQSHVLQRDDGMFVAGGGVLQSGGSNARQASPGAMDGLLEAARQLAPEPLRPALLLRHAEAVRPMPKDGLPVLGFVESGLYVIVSHSGVTLAPILGALAATELTMSVELAILDRYRPQRFGASSSSA